MIDFENKINEFCNIVDVVNSCEGLFEYLNEVYVIKRNEAQRKFSIIENYTKLTGSLIGNEIDSCLNSFLSRNSIYTFSHGGKYETDGVCSNPIFNVEFKSTGNINQSISGTKPSSKISKDRIKYNDDTYCYYIFIYYHIPTNINEFLTINKIQVGMLKPSDWKYNTKNKNSKSNATRIPSNIMKTQMKTIYNSNNI